MKTIFKAISASALLLIAGCATEINPEQAGPATRNIIVNAGPVATKVNFTDDGTSKVEVKWNEADEAFSAFIGADAAAAVVPFTQVSAPDATGSVMFSGNISAETAPETMVYAIYPKQTIETGNPAAVSLFLGEEPGIMSQAMNFMYAKSSLADLEDPSKSLQFTHLTSIIKVTMDFGEVEGSASNVVLTGDGLMRTATVDLTQETPVITPGKAGYIPVAGTYELIDGKATVYVHVLPAELSSLEISAKVGEDTYKATLTGKEMVAGKVYNVNATMAVAGVKKFTEIKLGMQSNTSTVTHYLSAADGVLYTPETVVGNEAKIDIVAFYSSTGKGSFTSPATQNAGTVFPVVKGWSSRNKTMFKLLTDTEMDDEKYAAITKASEITGLYDMAAATEATVVNNVTIGTFVAFKTSGGKYGVAKATFVGPGGNSVLKIDYTVTE